MAMLKARTASVKVDASKIDSRVSFNVDKRLSKEQKDAGVIAKVQVRHPAVTMTLTVWKKGGRRWVSEPAQKGSKQWFKLVDLNKNVTDYILSIVDNAEEERRGSYLERLGTHTYTITSEASNEDLGIENIIIDGQLSDNQLNKGMICKVNIVTTIGTLLNYTVWLSKFGKASLYGTAPSEGTASTDDDNNRRGAPGYRLTESGVDQVLNFLHPQVDFSAVVENASTETEESEESTEPDADEGFEPAGDEMFSVDK